MTERYRVGRSLGRTVYRQIGDDASKDDVLLGIFDDKAMASRVVGLLNAPDALAKVRELAARGCSSDAPCACTGQCQITTHELRQALGEADHDG